MMSLTVASKDVSPIDEAIWASKTVGELLRRAREFRGLTQKQVAERCEKCISNMSLSQIENDERIPKLKVCRKLAKALILDERRFVRFVMNIMFEDVRDLFEDEELLVVVGGEAPHPLDNVYEELRHAYDELLEGDQHQVLMAFQVTVRLAQSIVQARS